MVLLRICAALFITVPLLTVAAPAAAPRVEIALYYESYCGGCRDFIRDQLYPTFQKVSQIMDITLVPYGMAMPKRLKMEVNGASIASTVLKNAWET